MQRSLRYASGLISVIILLGALPYRGQAQMLPQVTKHFVDGAWRIDAFMETNESFPQLMPPKAHLLSALADGANLVFSSYDRDHNWNLYFISQTGAATTQQQLTNDAASDVTPRLNSKKPLIVFSSNRTGNYEIYTVTTNSALLTRLTTTTTDNIQPFWSPDGNKIVFSSKRDGNWNIYVMNADGSNPAALTSDEADDVMPSWAPNIDSIAWIRADDTTGTLWRMNADGGDPRAITEPLPFLQHPIWSPDGTRIAFDYDSDDDGFNDLATVSADGTDLRPIPISRNSDDVSRKLDLSVGKWTPMCDHLTLGVTVYGGFGGDLVAFNAYISGISTSGGTLSAMAPSNFDAQPDVTYPGLDCVPNVWMPFVLR